MEKNKPANIVIRLSYVDKTYDLGEEKLEILKYFSLTVCRGKLIAIVGPSGSGKSTLMHIRGLLDKQTTGTVELADHDVSDLSEVESAKLRNQYIGFIFQQFNLLSPPVPSKMCSCPLYIASLPPTKHPMQSRS